MLVVNIIKLHGAIWGGGHFFFCIPCPYTGEGFMSFVQVMEQAQGHLNAYPLLEHSAWLPGKRIHIPSTQIQYLSRATLVATIIAVVLESHCPLYGSLIF